MFFYENTSHFNYASFSIFMLFTIHLCHTSGCSCIFKCCAYMESFGAQRSVFPILMCTVHRSKKCIPMHLPNWPKWPRGHSGHFLPWSKFTFEARFSKAKGWCQLVRSMTRRRKRRSPNLITDIPVMIIQLGRMTSHSGRVEAKPASTIVWMDFFDFLISELIRGFCSAFEVTAHISHSNESFWTGKWCFGWEH